MSMVWIAFGVVFFAWAYWVATRRRLEKQIRAGAANGKETERDERGENDRA